MVLITILTGANPNQLITGGGSHCMDYISPEFCLSMDTILYVKKVSSGGRRKASSTFGERLGEGRVAAGPVVAGCGKQQSPYAPCIVWLVVWNIGEMYGIMMVNDS